MCTESMWQEFSHTIGKLIRFFSVRLVKWPTLINLVMCTVFFQHLKLSKFHTSKTSYHVCDQEIYVAVLINLYMFDLGICTLQKC